MTQVQGTVGFSTSVDGANPNFGMGRQNDVYVSELHGRYYTYAYRGVLFRSVITGVTIASTHVSPLAAGTGTPIIGLWNPQGTNKNVIVLRLAIATTSGTPGGPILWNWMNNQNITAAPGGTIYPGLLNPSANSVVKLFNNVATTGSTAGLPFDIAANISAVASTGGTFPAFDEPAGSIICQPGQMIALAATAAGTSHVVNASLTWAELPA